MTSILELNSLRIDRLQMSLILWLDLESLPSLLFPIKSMFSNNKLIFRSAFLSSSLNSFSVRINFEHWIFKIRQKMISRCHPAWSPYRLSCQRRVRRQRPTLSCGTPVPMTFLSHWCKASKLRWRILRKMLRRTLTPLPELTLFCHIIEDLGQVHRQAYLRLSIGQRTKRKGMYWNTNTDIQINYDHVQKCLKYWRENALTVLYFYFLRCISFVKSELWNTLK